MMRGRKKGKFEEGEKKRVIDIHGMHGMNQLDSLPSLPPLPSDIYPHHQPTNQQRILRSLSIPAHSSINIRLVKYFRFLQTTILDISHSNTVKYLTLTYLRSGMLTTIS